MKKKSQSKSRRSTAASRKAAKPRRKPIMRHSREGVKAKSKRKPRRKPRRKATPARSGRSPKQQYLNRLEREFATTLRVLKAYPAGQDEFRPHERSHSAVKLAHTFTQENGLITAVALGTYKMPLNLPPVPATYAEAVASFERGGIALIEAVRSMPDSRLSETVTFFTAPGQMGEVPVLDFLWQMLLDAIHHRGQLSVYVRMAGGKVPSIYGPSADEPWR